MNEMRSKFEQFLFKICIWVLRLNYYKRTYLIFINDLFISLLATSVTVFFYASKLSDAPAHILITYISTATIISAVLIYAIRTSFDDIRHVSIHNLVRVTAVATFKFILIASTFYVLTQYNGREVSPFYLIRCGFVDFLLTFFGLLMVRILFASIYRFYFRVSRSEKKNVLLFCPTSTNYNFADYINCNMSADMRVVAILSGESSQIGMSVYGLRIYDAFADISTLSKIIKQMKVDCIIFPSLSSARNEGAPIAQICLQHKVKLLIRNDIKPLDDDEQGSTNPVALKSIKIEELLSRTEINVDIENIKAEIQNDIILVTGAAGSIGSEIARQLCQLPVRELILIDIAESPLHSLKLEFCKKYPDANVTFAIADVKNHNRMENLIQKHQPSIIFHAAAYKHVPMMEENPSESICTNVGGSALMAKLAVKHGVRKFVMISSDKAVNPSNIMGATKRLAEMFVQSLDKNGKTQFITTRFGNVLGSNGSVIPLFVKQINEGGPITITHPKIIRYFMSIHEACRLVLQAATIGKGGQVLLFDMGEPQSILVLAQRLIRLYGLEPDVDIKITFTGLRPGEKLYEELLTTHENSEATTHEKIRIAQCAPIDAEYISQQIERILEIAQLDDIEKLVRHLKKLVPEYISKNNAIFASFDKDNSEDISTTLNNKTIIDA